MKVLILIGLLAGTYKGYPCENYCEAFKVGYDFATRNNITDVLVCEMPAISKVNPAFRIGCEMSVMDRRK